MSEPAYLPVYVDLRKTPCLVVGGGKAAFHKTALLVRFGATVSVLSREVVPEIEALVEQGKIAIQRKDYHSSDLANVRLVIVATQDRELNERIYHDALSRNVLINVVDVPELCTFIVPSVVKRGSLIIAISTEGKSPALAKRVRMELEEAYGDEYMDYVNYLAELRAVYKTRIASEAIRSKAFMEVIDSEAFDLIDAERRDEALALGRQILEGYVETKDDEH